MGWLSWGNIGGDGGVRVLSNEIKELRKEISELKGSQQVSALSESSDSVQAQGFLGKLFLDEASIEQIKKIIAAVDLEKVKAVMESIEGVEDGRVTLRLDLTLISKE